MLIATIINTGAAIAQDPDQQLLDQLYREIATPAAGKSFSVETSDGKPAISKSAASDRQNETPVPIAPDPTTEWLQQELEKIINDTRTRHAETVRFMQDTQ